MREPITIIIPYRNERTALRDLLRFLPQSIPVIVVDDASDAEPDKASNPDLHITWIELTKRGYFSGAVNAGIAACTTDVIVLNQDMVQVSDAWMAEIDRLRGTYAMIGDGVMNHPAWPRGYVQGTCMFLRRDAINAVGGMNERDWPLWGATAEYQTRLCRKGFKALPMDTSAWFAHGRDGKHGSAIAEFIKSEPQHADWAKRTPPMISVIIACYNYGRYLPDAINSLRGGMTSLGAHPGQTLAGWEAIIVDDASTDDTPAIAQSLADAWQGIRYIRLPHNLGTAGAYNAGIEASFGRYFMMLSADDMLEPTALDTMYRIVEDDQTAVAYTDLQIVRDGKRATTVLKNKKGQPILKDGREQIVLDIQTMHEYNFDELLDRNHVPAGIMATRAAWQAVGGYPVQFRHGREDWAMAVALGRAGYCGVRVPEPLYLYRREGQNRTVRNAGAEWRARFVAQMRDAFPDVYRGERPMACCGHGTRTPARTVQRAPSGAVKMTNARAGETGLTLMEYIGTSDGWASWWGPVTGIRYEFGRSKPVGYVDNRDVADLLNVVQGRRPVFRRYVQPVIIEQRIVAEMAASGAGKTMPPLSVEEQAGLAEAAMKLAAPEVTPVDAAPVQYAPGTGPLAVASLVVQDIADRKARIDAERARIIEQDKAAGETFGRVITDADTPPAKPKRTRPAQKRGTGKAKHV